MLTLDKVFDASKVLKEVIRPTACIFAPQINPDVKTYLKTENLQVTGSFKVRGAYYKISQLTQEESAHGVIACSAGNHAQGVALAATKRGISSVICLPDGAPISKVEATKSYGAQICLVPGVYDDAVVVVPVGGGGLISGVAFAIKQLRPSVRVYGVQATGAPSMVESLAEGKIKCLDNVHTIADGIKVKEPGVNTFEYCSKYVDGMVTVTDDEVSSAILHLIENQKLIAEGAGAVSVAAVMFNKVPAAVMFNKVPDIKGKKVVCLVSGGNIDVTILSRVIKRGLLKSGRSDTMTIQLEDKPGQLKGVSAIISDLGGNVVSIHHERASEDSDITDCLLRIVLETRDYEHIKEIRKALADNGFNIVNK